MRPTHRFALLLGLALPIGCASSNDTPSSSNPGGSSAGAGGSTAFGGSPATGGSSSLGGNLASGGNSASGGNNAAAGSNASGGSAGSGGSTSGGGTAGSGGSAARSDIVGKLSVGYQGWFSTNGTSAGGDGSKINWWHYTTNGQAPAPSNTSFYWKAWPDMGEYTKTYPVSFQAYGGKPAALFSSYDYSTVETQVKWMADNDINTIALQRFGDYRNTGEMRNVVTGNVKTAAEAHGVAFYIMYDISGWTNFDTEIPADWDAHMIGEEHVLDSTAYARQDGKPVVCIWGIGFLDRPATPTTAATVIKFFHDRGFYVIGGVGNDWRTADGTRWTKTGFGAVYDSLDAISPWMVGVIGDSAGSDNNRTAYNEGDVSYQHGHGKDYQPCVLPGDMRNKQRKGGDFMWHQFANMIQIKSDAIYISMFDEYNEGNQIAKTAATATDMPSDVRSAPFSMLSLSEDGINGATTACSSDYYLRLTGDGGKMLRGAIPFTFTRPTTPLP